MGCCGILFKCVVILTLLIVRANADFNKDFDITWSKDLIVRANADFNKDFDITWSKDHVDITNGGSLLQLKLDKSSGSGFASKNAYLFGSVSMDIKLVAGDSAGTVTTYYFASGSENRDELDFEFLGNVSGQPYILQTNVFASGKGGREERIYLWFDPTTAFHTYSVQWTRGHILFMVDSTPIRIYANNQASGVAYPTTQPMKVYSSLWNGDSWATRGGLDKINWNYAPFVASYQNFATNACVVTESDPNTSCTSSQKWGSSIQTLNKDLSKKLKAVRENYMVYDYCTDTERYPTPPTECNHEI